MLKQLFRRKLKIKQITSTSAGDYLFVYGLGNDGQIYTWYSREERWKLNSTKDQPVPLTSEQQAAVDAQEDRNDG